MTDYYARHLSGRRLQQVYDLASPRVKRYLEAEILHVIYRLRPTDTVLELGCGTGRVTRRLAEAARRVIGIDTSPESLALARELASDDRCEFVEMNALALRLPDSSVDMTVCVQNGICAFGVDPDALLREALRVTRESGCVLLSTYADRFWPDRLAWFEAQAAAGLLGPIDHAASRDGVIACTDGFRSGRLTLDDLRALCARVGTTCTIEEVDGSSVFCEISKMT